MSYFYASSKLPPASNTSKGFGSSFGTFSHQASHSNLRNIAEVSPTEDKNGPTVAIHDYKVTTPGTGGYFSTFKTKGLSKTSSRANLGTPSIASGIKIPSRASPNDSPNIRNAKEMKKNASTIMVTQKNFEEGFDKTYNPSGLPPKSGFSLIKKTPFESSEAQSQLINQSPSTDTRFYSSLYADPAKYYSQAQGDSFKKEPNDFHHELKEISETLSKNMSEGGSHQDLSEALRPDARIHSGNDSKPDSLQNLDAYSHFAEPGALAINPPRAIQVNKEKYILTDKTPVSSQGNQNFPYPFREKNVTGSGGWSNHKFASTSEIYMPKTSLTTLNFSKPGGFSSEISTLQTENTHLNTLVREQMNGILNLQKQKAELEENIKKSREAIQSKANSEIKEYMQKHLSSLLQKMEDSYKVKMEEILLVVREKENEKEERRNQVKRLEEEFADLTRESQSLMSRLEPGTPSNDRKDKKRSSSRKSGGKQLYVGTSLNPFSLGNSGLFSNSGFNALAGEEKELEEAAEFNEHLKSELKGLQEESEKLKSELEAEETSKVKMMRSKFESFSRRERALMSQEIEVGFSNDQEHFMKVIYESSKVLADQYKSVTAESSKIRKQLAQIGISPNLDLVSELSQLVREKETEIERMKLEQAFMNKEIDALKPLVSKLSTSKDSFNGDATVRQKINFDSKKKVPATRQHAPFVPAKHETPSSLNRSRYISAYSKKK